MKNDIKALFHVNSDSDTDKRITFDYGTDGQISAVLTQILFERHPESGEIKVSVGYATCIRQVKAGSILQYSYWQTDVDRVSKALQYVYGIKLRQELIPFR
ncbi:unnamed protein product [Adineta ricciae]|uniref:Uncharacterized protein n=1 Tax=Adineta ricciae TaxID=249248 RepID=A0A813V7J6_ADIRI|nr:unnamed protein product [Adineta ricciae]CAF1575229.1 unnamed protein product [Adineta ricciae]